MYDEFKYTPYNIIGCIIISIEAVLMFWLDGFVHKYGAMYSIGMCLFVHLIFLAAMTAYYIYKKYKIGIIEGMILLISAILPFIGVFIMLYLIANKMIKNTN